MKKRFWQAFARHPKVIVLHEDTRTGGFGGEIAARITEQAFEYLDGPIVRVTAPDTPVPFSPPLEEAFLPNAAESSRRRGGCIGISVLTSAVLRRTTEPWT